MMMVIDTINIEITNIQNSYFFIECSFISNRIFEKGQVMKIDNFYYYVHNSYLFENTNTTTLYSINIPNSIDYIPKIDNGKRINLINYKIQHYDDIIDLKNIIKTIEERKQKFKRLI
jgi:hypothetical protein